MRWVNQGLLFALALLIWPALALSATPEEAQQFELTKLRAQVAGEVQLSVYDLLDELVYHWTQAPPFTHDTPVFVAGITVPVGLGTGLEGLMENHLTALLLANPSTKVQLAHCPACTAVLVHSGAEGTVISRGLDNPKALAKIGGPSGRHGLYIDVSAEGAHLVLRARITKLTPDLPIVWSRTLSNAVGTPSMLRQPSALKSAAEARREYLDALHDKGPFTVPIRFAVRTYTAGYNEIAAPPLIWVQTGFEMALSQARAWTGSVLVGYAWLPDAYDGLMIQSRFSRLISGRSHSFTGPDVYLFLGGAIITVEGTAITPFQTEDMFRILQIAEQSASTRATFGTFHIGLELRVSDRIGASVFLENMPAYVNSDSIGSYLDLGFFSFQSLGTEVTFCF